MNKNHIFEVSQTIPNGLSKEEMLTALYDGLNNIHNIYSYLIYADYKDSLIVSWTVKYYLNEIEYYNTLSTKSVIVEIYTTLIKSTKCTSRIIGYKQPAFCIMLKLYTPLIRTLAKNQCTRWSSLEYEDAVSICQLTMLKLYKKGYYLHKHLLEKSFNNAILMSLRKDKFAPEIVSLDEIAYTSENDKQITLVDMLEDTQAKLQQEEKEYEEYITTIFLKMKEFIVDMIGERQFEQLFRDYANKHTTTWSRKTMQKIKKEIAKLGITKSILGGIE